MLPGWKKAASRHPPEAGKSLPAEEAPSAPATPGSRLADLLHWKTLPRPVHWFAYGVLCLFFWYGVLGTYLAGVGVDIAARPARELLPADGSVTVGMLGTLVETQIDGRSSYVANDPFFYPTGFARDTAAFQTRVLQVVEAATAALTSVHPSPRLEVAAQQLAVPPDQWWLSFRWPFFALPAERHYQAAITALGAFNHDLADRTPTPARPEGAAVAAGLGPGSRAVLEVLQQQLAAEAERGDRVLRGLKKAPSGVQLARARATAYAAALLLRGLQEDNAAMIRQSGMAARWGEARDALDQAATYSPFLTGGRELRTIGYSLLIANNAIHIILAGGNR